MKKTNITKNLKHGYIFLTGIVLLVFSASFATEMYFNGAFAFEETEEQGSMDEAVNEKADSEELFLEIQNIDPDFKTKESTITVVVFTNKSNKAWINGKAVEVDRHGVFESKVDLIVGKYEILIEIKSPDGKSIQESISVIREEVKKEEPKQEDKKTEQPPTQNTPPVNNPTPEKPQPTPEVPVDPPLTGLRLQCSITNTQPYVGQSVSLNCTVTDQNNKAVSGAVGSITVNWQSGGQTYQLSASNGSGAMNKNFIVPNGNSGSISGSVRVTKSGLTVTSNFSLTVQ